MFYGIKSSAFLLHETKPGVLAPATRLPAHTPSFFFFFFLHNSLRSSERQLTLLILERRRGREITHSSSCWGNTGRETEPGWETRRARPPDTEAGVQKEADDNYKLHSNLIGSNRSGGEDTLETPIYQGVICSLTCFSGGKISGTVWAETQFKTNN